MTESNTKFNELSNKNKKKASNKKKNIHKAFQSSGLNGKSNHDNAEVPVPEHDGYEEEEEKASVNLSL